MALTEIQQTTKEVFFQKIQGYANRINTMLLTIEDLTDFLVNIDGTELDRMSVSSDDQTKLARFRSRLNDLVSMADGGAVSAPTAGQELNTIIDSIRTM